ncbi:hypothetical protein WMY93_011216 [Mugilogobius chulae]|uniref:KID domain-containing protein n=1 Tax=Mugilogobius chulae TaxID=88201 RepID=A0AAW0P1W9_9GOBI
MARGLVLGPGPVLWLFRNFHTRFHLTKLTHELHAVNQSRYEARERCHWAVLLSLSYSCPGPVTGSGVIQSAQSSVIQSPQGHTPQPQGSDSDDSQDSSDSGATTQKTREILARRPSYRKIFNDLSSEAGAENNPASTGVTGVAVSSTPIYQTSTGQYITIGANGAIQLASPGSEGLQGVQALTVPSAGGAQPGTTILQYAQTPDGQQILVPSNQVVVQGAGGEMQTYQIRTTPSSSSLQQTVVMTTPVGLSQTKTDDPTLKREIRLAKNSLDILRKRHACPKTGPGSPNHGSVRLLAGLPSSCALQSRYRRAVGCPPFVRASPGKDSTGPYPPRELTSPGADNTEPYPSSVRAV